MKYCILDTSDKEITAKMKDLGFCCISVIPSERVSPPICRHTDVLYKKLNLDTIIVSSCQKANFPLLESLGYNIIINDKLNPGYKTECLLNYVINDSYIVYNPKTAEIPYDYLRKDIVEIKVKQGYTRCSVISVKNNAYITDDEGIHSEMIKNNIDCMLIPKGEIVLPGYDYGFIGGASLKLNEKEILFFGDFTDNNTKLKVVNFLNKYNISAQFIENKKLTDIGSGIIL